MVVVVGLVPRPCRRCGGGKGQERSLGGRRRQGGETSEGMAAPPAAAAGATTTTAENGVDQVTECEWMTENGGGKSGVHALVVSRDLQWVLPGASFGFVVLSVKTGQVAQNVWCIDIMTEFSVAASPDFSWMVTRGTAEKRVAGSRTHRLSAALVFPLAPRVDGSGARRRLDDPARRLVETAETGHIDTVAVTGDGRVVCLGKAELADGWTSILSLWSPASGELLACHKVRGWSPHNLYVTPSSRYLVLCSNRSPHRGSKSLARSHPSGANVSCGGVS